MNPVPRATSLHFQRCVLVSSRSVREAAGVVDREGLRNGGDRLIESLNSIQTMATTVKNNGEKIGKQAAKLLADVTVQLDVIDQHVAGLS